MPAAGQASGTCAWLGTEPAASRGKLWKAAPNAHRSVKGCSNAKVKEQLLWKLIDGAHAVWSKLARLRLHWSWQLLLGSHRPAELLLR